MRNRRAVSDDEDETPASPSPSPSDEEHRSKKKRKQIKLLDEDEEEEEKNCTKTESQPDEASGSENGGDDNEDEDDVDTVVAKPIEEPVRSSGTGRKQRNRFEAFEYDGCRYDREDCVLLVPEEHNKMPSVAIIKDITQSKDGSMMVLGQRFYRPEEAEKRGGGNWDSIDTRELFYSFHRDEVSADSVMHKCVVHFIPLNKQVPKRKDHPGFIVQRVYDTEERRLVKLTDNDYEDSKQHEIDLLVEKTIVRLGHVPDIETKDGDGC